jgi:hypothetical protein
MSGFEITAVYRLLCDRCGVYAEPEGAEYRTRADAVIARQRVARHESWLLRRLGPIDEFVCPDCAAGNPVGPPA